MKTILLIDDNEDFRRTATAMLQREGYSVIEAEDGAEGLARYQQEPTDLVITDLIMPVQGGADTVKELNIRYPGVKIIVVSGGGRVSPNSSLPEVAKLPGVLHTLAKPFERKDFLAVVAQALETAPAV